MRVGAISCVLLMALGCHDASSGARGDGGEPATSPADGTTVVASAVPSVAALPPFAPGALAGARVLLEKARGQEDARVRARMGAAILGELEERRLPSRVMGALVAASERRVEAAQRAEIVWNAIAQNQPMLDAWNRACESGAFVDGGRIVALVAPKVKDSRQRSATIFGLCRLERRGLLSLGDLGLDHDLVVLAHTVHAYLRARVSGSLGALAPEELQALVLLAKGGGPATPPIEETELPVIEEPKALAAPAAEALHKRVRAGVVLLQGGATKAFFEQLVHPAELGGLRLDAAVETFARSGKTKALREALELAAKRVAVDDGEGEASIRLPWRPQPDAPERVRFQLHDGVWFLRL